MQNATITRKGDELIIKIDLSQTIGPSKSGKTVLVASSHGNVPVPGFPEARLGFNLYTNA